MENTNNDELREAFNLFDADGDGQVSMTELENMFMKLGTDGQINESEIHALLKIADKDESGTITFDEFHVLWDKVKAFGDHLSAEEELIRQEFDKLDTDRSGFISKAEMLASINHCDFLNGDKEKEAKRCLDDIDVNGDGQVSYPEFLMVWKFKY
jgi:Ca2+-binding EF-hand superfamily protein